VRFVDVKPGDLKDHAFHEIASCMIYSKNVTRTAKEIRPDIVCLNDRLAGYFPSKLAIPKTFTTHNPDAMTFYRNFSVEKNKLNSVLFGIKNKMEKTVMSRSDAIIALTKSIQEYLGIEGIERSYLIPNAVDPRDYSNRGDDGYILYAGRLNKVKGLVYLLDAFSQVQNEIDSNLLLVGSGDEDQNLRRIVVSKGMQRRVHFVPMVGKKELAEYLSKCSVFVLPSIFEIMPVVMLEAMASEKTVIASRISGPKDVIEHGRNGLLFEKGDVRELSRLLRETLGDKQLRLRLGRCARDTVLSRHTFEKIAVQYERVFKTILE
jgi:glycosyltransferase involved in cell wall biosynthesis